VTMLDRPASLAGALLWAGLLLPGTAVADTLISHATLGTRPGQDVTRQLERSLQRSAGTVRFAPGRYIISSVAIPAGVTRVAGRGATLVTRPKAGKYNYMLIARGRRAAPIVFEGLQFDLNHKQQDWQGGFDLEHQSGIFLEGTAQSPLKAIVRRCAFRNGAGDGITIHHHVRAGVYDCRAEDVFRGGVVVTGRAAVEVQRFRGSGEDRMRSGIDVEPESGAAVRIGIRDVQAPQVDILLPEHSEATVSEVQTDSLVMLCKGKCTLSDSAAADLVVKTPGQTVIRDCEFHSAAIRWWVTKPRSGQQIVFQRCRFTSADEREAAVRALTDRRDYENRLLLSECTIAGDYDYGVSMDRGGTWTIRDCSIQAETAYRLRWIPKYFYDVLLDGNELQCPTVWFSPYDHAENTVTHQNTSLAAEDNVFATRKGMHFVSANRYLGSRRIAGDHDPTETPTPGLPGDVFHFGPKRWKCVGGDYEQARWEPLPDVAQQSPSAADRASPASPQPQAMP